MMRTSTSLFAAALLALAGCSSSTVGGASSSGSGASSGGASSGSSGGSTGSSLPACQSCFDDSNCQSGHCVQLGSDGYCLDPCASGCASGDTCEQLADSAGNPQQVCVPNSGSCTSNPAQGACPQGCSGSTYCDAASATCVAPSGSSSGSSGTTGSSGNCGNDLAPTTPDTNHACTCGASNPADCQVNDCYGGWYCDPTAHRCVSPTTACGTSTTTTSGTTSSTTGSTGTTTGTTTSGTTGSTGAGTPWTGSVNQSGGSVSRLYFAAVGDSRPPSVDDISNYPTAIITKIYQDMQNLSPRPEFAVSTGDYMFASPSGSQGAQQLGLYVNARNAFSGVLFASMGNHECTGYTSSNCLPGNSSNNYAAFMDQLMQPIGQTKPYYRFDVNDSNGAWTAKFIVLAMNAWDSTQGNWLQQQLAQPTTYTFIIRHEPESATTAPGVTPSDNIISQYPYTLKIVGHTHEFGYWSNTPREVIVGNGGAPLANTTSTYGYALIQQLADGNLQVQELDYNSNAPLRTYTIAK